MIGLWIDSLTDEQRDGIIEHPDPTFRGNSWHDGRCGCLVGCVVMATPELAKAVHEEVANGYEWNGSVAVQRAHVDAGPQSRLWYYGSDGVPMEIGGLFPYLIRRFGPERIWRAVKMRAAKANKIDLGARLDQGTSLVQESGVAV